MKTIGFPTLVSRGKVARRLFAALVPLLAGFVATAMTKAAALSPPSRPTTVLLLPAADETPDAANMLRPRQLVIRHRLQVEFLGRQFRVAGENLAQRAAAEPPVLDLAGSQTRSPAVLDELARRCDADWVVCPVVLSAEASAGADGGFVVDTSVRMKIWDARRHAWLLDRPTVGRVTATGAPPLLFLRSLDTATKDALQPLLAAVPVVVRLRDEDSLVDYLENQTAPIVGDAGAPFVAASRYD